MPGTHTTAISIPQLRSSIEGTVTVPGDPGFDDARSVFYGGIDRRPAVIVRAASADDVSQVIALARESGIELAIRSGGHSIARHSTSEGGVVLDLRGLDLLEIDVEGRTAWVGGGVTTGHYTEVAAKHGLATPFGDTGSVGIGGLTLGGGVGYLVRKHGLTVDNLLAADVVTADGKLVHADANSHPDLFWAIRGGGGNFGVATRFHFRLHELAGVVGGTLILPASADAISGFIAAAEAAPDELSAIANVMPAPPFPFLSAEQHGHLVIFAVIVYAGEVEDGERALAPFRALAEPIADMTGPKAYPEIFMPVEQGFQPFLRVGTMYSDTIDRAAAQTIIEQLAMSQAGVRVAQLRVLGGEAARVPVDATAYAHRHCRIMVNVAASFRTPEEAEIQEPWVGRLGEALSQDDSGAYVGFLGDEAEERIRAAYPGETWNRLVAVKRRYDPANLFRLNQNVQPD